MADRTFFKLEMLRVNTYCYISVATGQEMVREKFF